MYDKDDPNRERGIGHSDKKAHARSRRNLADRGRTNEKLGTSAAGTG
ncbi:hypothetical protein HMPREF9413_2767 [Paenibacillus sp. HGF7]|nr:hypothetical protein HMPREF9413_2767 [Paenibacillus sp. HGF7]